MFKKRPTRSISLPIVLGSITVALSITMLVGWILVLWQNRVLSREVTQNTWLLIGGILSLVMIAIVLVMLSAFLVREILELRRQDNFIDSVTHELKSPLASLKLCLETLERKGLDAQQKEALHVMMIDDVERLSVFIDDVLESSRATFARRGLNLSRVDLNELLEHCADTVCKRYKLDPSVIHFIFTEHIEIFSDRLALEIIFKNLIDNAVKYSQQPIEITIEMQSVEHGLLVYVKDNGIGVPQKELKRIFDRFYRVSSEAVRQRKGTGLGLYVVQALIKSLDGSIRATLPEKGGLSIQIFLPNKREPNE